MLDDTVNKYNHTVHKTIKMKPTEVTSNSYAENNEDSNESEPKLGDRVRISKHLLKDTQNWSEEVFVVSKIKNAVPYVASDLNGEPITRSFYEKELQKTSQEKFRIEKVTKRIGDKLHDQWKGYDNSFNSLINKKDLV